MNKTTTAIIEYRPFVPSGWIATKFARIDFTGYDYEKYENECMEAAKKEKDCAEGTYLENIEKTESEISSKEREIKKLESEHRMKGILWRVFNFSESKKIREKIERAKEELIVLILRKDDEEIKLENAFDVYDKVYFYREFLKKRGFYMYDKKKCGEECFTYIECFRLEE